MGAYLDEDRRLGTQISCITNGHRDEKKAHGTLSLKRRRRWRARIVCAIGRSVYPAATQHFNRRPNARVPPEGEHSTIIAPGSRSADTARRTSREDRGAGFQHRRRRPAAEVGGQTRCNTNATDTAESLTFDAQKGAGASSGGRLRATCGRKVWLRGGRKRHSSKFHRHLSGGFRERRHRHYGMNHIGRSGPTRRAAVGSGRRRF